MGPARRQSLLLSHGFICTCERCDAQPGSPLFEHEREELGLLCPHGDGSGCDGHRLLPHEPYAASPEYACAATTCSACLSADDAAVLVDGIRASFEALHGELCNGQCDEGCSTASLAEHAAAKVLAPRHSLWTTWTAAVIGLVGGAQEDQTELLVRAHSQRVAVLDQGARAGDEDIFMQINHALVVGLETQEGAASLRFAFRLDQAEAGSDPAGFITRWIPREFDAVLPVVQRALSSP